MDEKIKGILLTKLGMIIGSKVFDVKSDTFIHIELLGQSEIEPKEFQKLSQLARDFKLTVNIYPIPPNKIGIIIDTDFRLYK